MKELKELLSFTISGANALDKSLSDNKLDVSDLFNFLPVFLKAQDAFKGLNQIKSEWDLLTFESKQLLIKELEQELDLRNEKTEQIIEKSLVLVLGIFELISLIKA